jgi:hypothetical protein
MVKRIFGLPIADWVLGVLGGVCPQWLIRPTYQDLRELLPRAYQWSALGLGRLVVHRWLNVGWSGVMLGS